MAYSYGFDGPSGRYGGSGGFGGGYGGGAYGGGSQEYTRNRHAPYGGDGAYGVYSGDRDYDRGYGSYGVGGGHGGNRGASYRTETVDYTTSGTRGGGDRSYGGVGVYGGGYGSGVRDYEREQRSSRKNRTGGVGVSYGKNRSYRDTTDRSYSKYRNKRDTSTSSSSSSDDDNREGFMQRAADKIKGVFGYGPDGQNNYNNDQSYGAGYGGYSSSRKNKYNDNSRYNTTSYGGNTGNHGAYGSYGGGYGGNDIVSLRGRREIQPSLNEESGNKSLLWQVNVRGFDLDDIKVSDAGSNKIEISGHSEDVGQHHRRTKQFTRIITLPEGSNAKEVKSRVSGSGLLTITVPYTGKGLKDYGTRELQVGQGSTHALTGRTGTTGSSGTSGSNTTGSYGTSGSNTGTTGGQYQQHTTTSTTRTATNNQ